MQAFENSSGSAALVVAGECDMAIGATREGRSEFPSSFCGAVGHKPTHGLVPYTGVFPIELTLDHTRPIARWRCRPASRGARRSRWPRPAPAGGTAYRSLYQAAHRSSRERLDRVGQSRAQELAGGHHGNPLAERCGRPIGLSQTSAFSRPWRVGGSQARSLAMTKSPRTRKSRPDE